MTLLVVTVSHYWIDRTTAYGRIGTRVHYDGTEGRLGPGDVLTDLSQAFFYSVVTPE
jgi:hypothetical protein